MFRAFLLLVFSWIASAEATERPDRSAFRRALQGSSHALVEVVGPKRKGTGIIVSSQGHVVTSVEFVGMDTAKVWVGAVEHEARVLMADAKLKIAVVMLPAGAEYPSAAVKLQTDFPKLGWLLGVVRGPKGEPTARMGQTRQGLTEGQPFFDIGFPLPPGSPVLDPLGRVVAVAVGSGRSSRQALPVATLKTHLHAAMALP